jgi:hypothetical protein
MKNLENEYPINTFSGETKRELLSLFRRKEKEIREDERNKVIEEIIKRLF